MSIQLIWKRLIANKVPLSPIRLSVPISLLLPFAIIANPHIKMAKFCTETATSSSTPQDRSVVTDFFINKCEMTEKDVSKVFKLRKNFLLTSSQNLEKGLELLNECGLTTPGQIRKAILCSPSIFSYKLEGDIKSRISFLRSVIKKEDLCKIIYRYAQILRLREDKLQSVISLLQRLGIEGETLSKLVARQPRLLTYSEEKVIGSFKAAEGLGVDKGLHIFGPFLRATLGMGKEKIDRKLQFLSGLGFPEKQISELSSRTPFILGLSEEKLKRHVEFLVKSLGLPFDDIVRYPCLLTCSLEKRIIPRYRVMEALKSMQLLKTERKFACVVQDTDKCFMEKYVNSNAEFSSALWNIYYGGKAGKVDH